MSAPTPKTRWAVIARDSDEEGNPVCQWKGHGVRIEWGQYSLQHRRARGMGSPKFADANQPQNLVLVCGSATTGCHGEIEAHPDLALARGFRIPRAGIPARVPLIDHTGAAVLLTEDGRRVPAPVDPD